MIRREVINGQEIEFDEDGEMRAPKKSWYYLILVTLIGVSNYQQGMIFPYSYAKHEIGEKAGNGIFELSSAFPELNDFYFGLISGIEYNLPLAIFSIIAGAYTVRTSRKWLLCGAAIAWSCVTAATSQADNIAELQLSMILFGTFSAAVIPASLSLVSDYFPPNHRSFALGIQSTVIYWGGFFSSMANFLTCFYGWRMTYAVAGSIGLALGVSGLIVLEEPKVGAFDEVISTGK